MVEYRKNLLNLDFRSNTKIYLYWFALAQDNPFFETSVGLKNDILSFILSGKP